VCRVLVMTYWNHASHGGVTAFARDLAEADGGASRMLRPGRDARKQKPHYFPARRAPRVRSAVAESEGLAWGAVEAARVT